MLCGCEGIPMKAPVSCCPACQRGACAGVEHEAREFVLDKAYAFAGPMTTPADANALSIAWQTTDGTGQSPFSHAEFTRDGELFYTYEAPAMASMACAGQLIPLPQAGPWVRLRFAENLRPGSRVVLQALRSSRQKEARI